MSKRRKPNDPFPLTGDLQLTWTTRRHDRKGQEEDIVKLRRLTDAGETDARDEFIHGLFSNPVAAALCPKDVATAARLIGEEEIKQIRLRWFTEERRRANDAAKDLVWRHSPPGLLPTASR